MDSVRANKRQIWTGRHSKGSRSPMATTDSWRAPASISCLEASGDIAGVREDLLKFLAESGKWKKKNRTGAYPKGHGRPVRPKTAGGRHTPFLTWRPRQAAWELTQLAKVFRQRERRIRERKGLVRFQRVRVAMATNDSWRTPMPFLTGKLWKVVFLPHWRTKNMW